MAAKIKLRHIEGYFFCDCNGKLEFTDHWQIFHEVGYHGNKVCFCPPHLD